MVAGRRADGAEYAQRVNVAAELVDAGMSTVDAARVLADRFAVSQRQARRYVEQAASGGRVSAPEATTVFTVSCENWSDYNQADPTNGAKAWILIEFRGVHLL